MLATELHDFWFDPATEPSWFGGGAAFDAMLRLRFEPVVHAAARGALDALRGEPRGVVILGLALDQLPRNIWRGTPRAFAYDTLALGVAREAVAAGLDRALDQAHRLFLYLPFEHSEDIADQREAMRLFGQLDDEKLIGYARAHHDIVARFGRFPHRNAVLGRASTAEELAFLREPGSSFYAAAAWLSGRARRRPVR
jgi:uncharacterized protein (DUF924 family)